jgi:hypothetical protein
MSEVVRERVFAEQFKALVHAIVIIGLESPDDFVKQVAFVSFIKAVVWWRSVGIGGVTLCHALRFTGSYGVAEMQADKLRLEFGWQWKKNGF